MSNQRIELIVDELVLVGADPRDARCIGESIERAVTEQIATMPVSGFGRAARVSERLDGGEFSIRGQRDVASYGQGVAAAITRSVVARTV